MSIIDNIKSFVTGKAQGTSEVKYYNSIMGSNRSYVGDNLSACGNVRFTKQSFYDIHKNNLTINSYYRKIVKMVAKHGFVVYDMNNEIVDNESLLEEIYKFIWHQDLDILKQQVYTQAFCSGQLFGIVGKINMLGETKLKVLDSRGMKIDINKYGEPIKYFYSGWADRTHADEFSPEDIVDDIVFYDHDLPYQWVSMYQGLLVDAMTDSEASKTNFYYFENNARPWMIVRLSDSLLQNSQELENFKKQWREKYAGSKNNNKPIISAWVEDVKVIEMKSNENQLLDLRKYIDTRVWLTFGLDKRLIWYNVEWGGSRAEISSVSQIQGNVKISEYADILNNFLTTCVKKFLFPNWGFEWYRIVSVNDKFSNEYEDMKLSLELVRWGCISREEFRKEYDMPIEGLPEEMSKFTISSSEKFIDERQENGMDWQGIAGNNGDS